MRRQALTMTWTPGVEPEEARVMIMTVHKVMRQLRQSVGPEGQFDPFPTVRVFGAWMIPAVPQGAAYWGIEWYVQQSLDPSETYLLGSRYLSTISMEPWQIQDPHFDMSMTDIALIDDSNDTEPEVLGVSRPGMASVMSMNLLREITDARDRRVAVRQMVAHYFGRMTGVPRLRGRSDVVTFDNILLCTNVCAMRPLLGADEALAFGLQQRDAKVVFCEACQLDLISLLAGFHYGLN